MSETEKFSWLFHILDNALGSPCKASEATESPAKRASDLLMALIVPMGHPKTYKLVTVVSQTFKIPHRFAASGKCSDHEPDRYPTQVLN